MEAARKVSRFTAPATNEAVDYYERALKLEPENTRAQILLSMALGNRALNRWSADRAADIGRAEKPAT
jgi:hypothetical protein